MFQREKTREDQARTDRLNELKQLKENRPIDPPRKKQRDERVGRAEFERYFVTSALEVSIFAHVCVCLLGLPESMMSLHSGAGSYRLVDVLEKRR